MKAINSSKYAMLLKYNIESNLSRADLLEYKFPHLSWWVFINTLLMTYCCNKGHYLSLLIEN